MDEAQLVCTDRDCGGPTCTRDGSVTYYAGESVEISCETCDNVCTCEETGDGQADWVCTYCECPQVCEYEGIIYQPEEEVPASDDCNVCVCKLNDYGFGITEASYDCTLIIC